MSGSSIARRQMSAVSSMTVNLCCAMARSNHCRGGSESSSRPLLYFWPISKALIADTPKLGVASMLFSADSLNIRWLIASHRSAQVSRIIARLQANPLRMQARSDRSEFLYPLTWGPEPIDSRAYAQINRPRAYHLGKSRNAPPFPQSLLVKPRAVSWLHVR